MSRSTMQFQGWPFNKPQKPNPHPNVAPVESDGKPSWWRPRSWLGRKAKEEALNAKKMKSGQVVTFSDGQAYERTERGNLVRVKVDVGALVNEKETPIS